MISLDAAIDSAIDDAADAIDDAADAIDDSSTAIDDNVVVINFAVASVAAGTDYIDAPTFVAAAFATASKAAFAAAIASRAVVNTRFADAVVAVDDPCHFAAALTSRDADAAADRFAIASAIYTAMGDAIYSAAAIIDDDVAIDFVAAAINDASRAASVASRSSTITNRCLARCLATTTASRAATIATRCLATTTASRAATIAARDGNIYDLAPIVTAACKAAFAAVLSSLLLSHTVGFKINGVTQ